MGAIAGNDPQTVAELGEFGLIKALSEKNKKLASKPAKTAGK